ncbi:hypothetical protein [Pseudophaeobacter sp. EL27]|uniref:hypothetical protein n=1 Tax=Pseudophaeobacter sp. EL27 TaxID=2107580 RepID=UPI000EFD1A11|nr:hypothetical protein [Pseudophaeobacter sp. EL27]
MRIGIRKSLRQAMFRLKSRSLCEEAGADIRALAGREDGGEGGGIVVFTSYNANAAKRGLLEFAASASNQGARHCIFVTDRRQGWFQGQDFSSAVLRAVSDYVSRHRLTRLMTVGVSMGGYGAVSYAAELGADSALAFAPQYCPRPGTFPADQRWAEARARIPEFSRPSLNESMGSQIQYTLLHGRWNAEDSQHWQAFAQGSKIDHFLADRSSHDVIDPLREAGVLYPVVDAAWVKDRTRMRNLMRKISALPRAVGECAENLNNNRALNAQLTTSYATN